MKNFFLILLPLILAAEPAPQAQPSRVTLDARSMSLGEAAASIARQANIPIDTEHALKDRPIQLRLSNSTFWDALDELACAANQRLVVSGQGKRIAFSKEPYREFPRFSAGPFRFAARETRAGLEFATGRSRTNLYIDLAWEPKFKGYFVEMDPKSLAARDDQSHPLVIVNEGANRVPVTDSEFDLQVKFQNVPRSTKKIAELTGAVKILGTSQLLQFSFDPAVAGNQTIKKPEVSATLKTFRKNVRLWTAVVELHYPKDMPELESFQSYLLDNEAWLLSPSGRKFRTDKFELGFNQQGKLPITFYFEESDKDGPVLKNLTGWKLVVRVPGRIMEERVNFRLRDIPLP